MNTWKQGGQMTIRINHEDSSVELTRPKESDTWGPVLDMCYDAVRALGFVFESPDGLLDKQERLLGQIHEAVEQYIPVNADVDSVLDGVRKAIDYLVDEWKETERLLEDSRTFNATQQLGIDAQKKRIEELETELDKIRPLAAPIAEVGGILNIKARKGTFLWAACMVDVGQTVRRAVLEWSPARVYVVDSEDLAARDWEISP